MAGFTLSTPAAVSVSAVGGVVVVCRVVWRRGPGRAGAAACVRWQATRKGGPLGGPPPFLVVWAAVSYSPTPWRVQYHRRWQS